MSDTVVHVGIDVAKDFVDVALSGGGARFRLATDEAGLDALVERLSALGPAVVAGLEASGGYERVVMRRLREAMLAVRLVDPARVRQFARKVLYMAAIAAARCNPPIRAFHQRLRDQGKPPKLAITACMRKLLLTLNAIARDQVEWKTVS